MSTFEQRVQSGARASDAKRFRILSQLDAGLAQAFANGMSDGQLTVKEVNLIMDEALDGSGQSTITKEEEEALCIILATPAIWAPGARDHMIDRIEEELSHVWSAKAIDSHTAAKHLANSNHISFKSRGDKYPGTGVEFTPRDYQAICQGIRLGNIGAWEVPPRRAFLRTWAGLAGADGVYLSHRNDLYLVNDLAGADRAAKFVHEATHAIQDLHNIEAMAKYVEADAYIAMAAAAWTYGVPYYSGGKRTEEIATRTAAKLLMNPTRGKDWGKQFCKAYDQVVDAFAATHSRADADAIISMRDRESKRRQAEDKLLLAKLRAAVTGKRRK